MDDKGKKFIVGIFEDEDILLNAITTVRDKGINIYEVYSPFPVHGIENKLGYKRSRLSIAAFCFGFLGTGMPQVKEVLLIDRSLRPFLTNCITSFFLELGKIKLGFFSKCSNNLFWHLDNLKKKDSSSTHSTTEPEVFEIFLLPSVIISSSS